MSEGANRADFSRCRFSSGGALSGGSNRPPLAAAFMPSGLSTSLPRLACDRPRGLSSIERLACQSMDKPGVSQACHGCPPLPIAEHAYDARGREVDTPLQSKAAATRHALTSPPGCAVVPRRAGSVIPKGISDLKWRLGMALVLGAILALIFSASAVRSTTVSEESLVPIAEDPGEQMTAS